MENVDTRHIYIIISQTGTLLSRILRRVTGAEYNHVSIGLNKELEFMYSFGRKNPYNPFWGGFVVESPHSGTFKRFYNTRVVVLDLEIDALRYEGICRTVNEMLKNRAKYGYNCIGLLLAAFKIVYRAKNHYYCSEFVKYMLQKYNIEGSEALPAIAQPIHFLNIPKSHLLYIGKLTDYEALEYEAKTV